METGLSAATSTPRSAQAISRHSTARISFRSAQKTKATVPSPMLQVSDRPYLPLPEYGEAVRAERLLYRCCRSQHSGPCQQDIGPQAGVGAAIARGRTLSALMVLMNGPRYFIMDEIGASGASASGKTIDIDGMELTMRASIDLGLFDLLHRPYREITIDRDTIYRFKAGSPVFLLEAPGGSRYIMQAYAQIVDKTLTYERFARARPQAEIAFRLALLNHGAATGHRRRRQENGDRGAGRSRQHLSEARLTPHRGKRTGTVKVIDVRLNSGGIGGKGPARETWQPPPHREASHLSSQVMRVWSASPGPTLSRRRATRADAPHRVGAPAERSSWQPSAEDTRRQVILTNRRECGLV